MSLKFLTFSTHVEHYDYSTNYNCMFTEFTNVKYFRHHFKNELCCTAIGKYRCSNWPAANYRTSNNSAVLQRLTATTSANISNVKPRLHRKNEMDWTKL